ncbi:MAG: DNA alkylation repair protein [Alphaproteobacteria bacterium]|nr:DNA alkylation repair protein [Alphaproteobacteria bacterium]
MFDNNIILNSLYAAEDAVYREFNSKLIPTVSANKIIGVRTPVLRAMARNMVKTSIYKDFIQTLPHEFFEENQLHAFIISGFNNFDLVVRAVDEFLPYVDNWATCDQMSPKVFAKNTDKLLPCIKKWIRSKHVYTVRFAILSLMRYYMDANFDTKYADMVFGIKSDEYYINMMRAWFFATAAAKHFDLVYPYFERLDSWTRARAIQKATESYRVSPEHKVKLKALREKL